MKTVTFSVKYCNHCPFVLKSEPPDGNKFETEILCRNPNVLGNRALGRVITTEPIHVFGKPIKIPYWCPLEDEPERSISDYV